MKWESTVTHNLQKSPFDTSQVLIMPSCWIKIWLDLNRKLNYETNIYVSEMPIFIVFVICIGVTYMYSWSHETEEYNWKNFKTLSE